MISESQRERTLRGTAETIVAYRHTHVAEVVEAFRAHDAFMETSVANTTACDEAEARARAQASAAVSSRHAAAASLPRAREVPAAATGGAYVHRPSQEGGRSNPRLQNDQPSNQWCSPHASVIV